MDSDDNDALDFDGHDAEVDMNTSLSEELAQMAEEALTKSKRDRLHHAAARALELERALQKKVNGGANIVVFPKQEPLREQLTRSLEMLGPKDSA